MADNKSDKKPLSISQRDLGKHADISKKHSEFAQHLNSAMNMVYTNPLKQDKEFLTHANNAASIYSDLRDQGIDHNSIVSTYHSSKGDKGMNDYWKGKSSDMCSIIGSKYDKLKQKEKEAMEKGKIKKSLNVGHIGAGRVGNMLSTFGVDDIVMLKGGPGSGRHYEGGSQQQGSAGHQGGEGSRGGKVVGHTRSGKPIYLHSQEEVHSMPAKAPHGMRQSGHNDNVINYYHKKHGYDSAEDHEDAHAAIKEHFKKNADDKKKYGRLHDDHKWAAYNIRDNNKHEGKYQVPKLNDWKHKKTADPKDEAKKDQPKKKYDTHNQKVNKMISAITKHDHEEAKKKVIEKSFSEFLEEKEIEKGGVGSGRKRIFLNNGKKIHITTKNNRQHFVIHSDDEHYKKGDELNNVEELRTHGYSEEKEKINTKLNDLSTYKEVKKSDHSEIEKSFDDQFIELRFNKAMNHPDFYFAVHANYKTDSPTLDQKKSMLYLSDLIGDNMIDSSIVKSEDGVDMSVYDLIDEDEKQILCDLFGFTEKDGIATPNIGLEKAYVELLVKAKAFQIGQLDKAGRYVKTADGWKPVKTHGHLITKKNDSQPVYNRDDVFDKKKYDDFYKRGTKKKISNIDEAMAVAQAAGPSKQQKINENNRKQLDDFEAKNNAVKKK